MLAGASSFECSDCKLRLFESNYHTLICLGCGRETHAGLNPALTSYTPHPPRALPPTYNRSVRFKELLNKLLGQENGPKDTDPVWVFLKKHAPYSSPEAIFNSLKQSGLINKHYGSCHLFTKIFCPQYTPIELQDNQTIRAICTRFDDILHMWRVSAYTTFFSYNFLIETFLVEQKLHTFLPFLKKLQCPKRRLKYSDKLLSIEMKCRERGSGIVKRHQAPVLGV